MLTGQGRDDQGHKEHYGRRTNVELRAGVTFCKIHSERKNNVYLEDDWESTLFAQGPSMAG